jgi:RNA polymerase sigma factor (sigma-70 family)
MTDPLRAVSTAASPAAVETNALSFEEFFEHEKGELYGALCLVTRNRHEAEEVTQDTFVRLLERWDRVGTLEDPRGYLYRTAMNSVRSRHRRALLAARRGLGVTPQDDAIAAVEARDAAVQALAPLSPRQRAAVVLTDLLGYTSDEAARMLGIRPSTLRMHASRARAALKETLRDE